MAPAPPHPMRTYEARKASFLQKDAAPGPSRKKAAATTKPTWPHPFSTRSNDRGKGSSSDDGGKDDYPSPRSLANLGLYYDPTLDANDQCSVYPDGQSVSGWRQGQSALERLEEEDPLISWVMIEKSKRASEEMTANEGGKLVWAKSEEAKYPSGKAMIDARLRTYGGAWPLDGKKGWKPTSKKLASAGFHFSPNDDEEDCVSCAYCQCSLGGWEKADDPVKEHQKRKPECAIFISELEKVDKKQETSTRAANSSVAKSRTASRKRAAEPDKLEEEEVTTSPRTRSRPSKSNDIQEEAKDSYKDDEEDAKPAAKKRKKATTTKSRPASKKTTVVDVEEGEKEEVVPPKSTKAKKVAKKGTSKKKAEVEKPVDEKVKDMDIDDKEVEASDFEEAPSRSHSRDSEKGVNAPTIDRGESPPTSCGSETFKTPKQAASGRPTEKTPKASSPVVQKIRKASKALEVAPLPAPALEPASLLAPSAQRGSIAAFEKLKPPTDSEKLMTVKKWLEMHVDKACSDLEAEGLKKIAKLKEEMARGKAEAERILRGINVN